MSDHLHLNGRTPSLRCARVRPHACMALLGGALLAMLCAPRAHGYAEDICYADVADPAPRLMRPLNHDNVYLLPFSCYDLTCSDGPEFPDQLPSACLPEGFADLIGATMFGTYHANSSLHYENVYLFARIAGIPDEEARVIAKASQNVDLGDWRPIEQVVSPRRRREGQTVYRGVLARVPPTGVPPPGTELAAGPTDRVRGPCRIGTFGEQNSR